MQEKYGFVYIWFDRKKKRYYVGCHWGTEDDGYICSSRWMRKSYKRRPQDFKRRILVRTNIREELFQLEDKYLQMIKKEEFKVRYYNLQNHVKHWSEKEQSRLSVGQKISIHQSKPEIKEKSSKAHKERWANNEFRSLTIANMKGKKRSPEANEANRQRNLKRMANTELRAEISRLTKEAMARPEVKLKQAKRVPHKWTEEERKKRSEQYKGRLFR